MYFGHILHLKFRYNSAISSIVTQSWTVTLCVTQLRNIGLTAGSKRPLPGTVWQRIKLLGLNCVKPTRRGYRGGVKGVHTIIYLLESRSTDWRTVMQIQLASILPTWWPYLRNNGIFHAFWILTRVPWALRNPTNCLPLSAITRWTLHVCLRLWFSGHVSNDAVALPGFPCERKDRQKKKAGGVACYIRNSVPYKRLQNLEDDTHEAVWINSRPRHLPRQFSCIAVGCIYHPPDADNTSMHDYLINCIDHILRMHPSCGVIVTGDFNQLRDSFLRSHYTTYSPASNLG